MLRQIKFFETARKLSFYRDKVTDEIAELTSKEEFKYTQYLYD